MKISIKQKLISLILLLALITCSMFGVTWCVAKQQKDDGLIVNLAGRQRMLIQKMTKETLMFHSALVKDEKYAKQIMQTMAVFNKTLSALKDSGNAPLDINLDDTEYRYCPRATGLALAQLEKVQGMWKVFSGKIESVIENRSTADENIRWILKNNMSLLKEIDNAVVMMQKQSEAKVNFLLILQIAAVAVSGCFVLFALMVVVRVTNNLNAEIAERKEAEEAIRKSEENLKAANQQLQSEIVERKKAGEKIQASLKEKEMLLREIHHRVKNNMQVIASLLHIQSKVADDRQVSDIFRECENRIESMSYVHEKLYQSKDLMNIDLKEYIIEVTDSLAQSYGIDANEIVMGIDVEDVSLGIDLALPCGMVINELISNSLKYAFPEGRNGEIKICLMEIEDQIELRISDNGVGIPQDLDFRKTESLGLQLVTAMVKNQLSGEIELNRSAGTEFIIRFRAYNEAVSMNEDKEAVLATAE